MYIEPADLRRPTPEELARFKPLSPEDEPATKSRKPLGHIATESVAPSERPVLDIHIDAVDEAVMAPAGAEPYLGKATIGLEIPESKTQADEAIKYAKEIFPDSEFSSLGSGRYGIALADKTGKVFKVYRDAYKGYSRSEKEAGALKLLSEAGLAPRLHMFVDAGEQYRLDMDYRDHTDGGFGQVQIPRQNSGRALPILVMDKVDVAPLETAAPDKLADAFTRATELFLREKIHCWDSDVVVDKKTGDVLFLDVGELSQEPTDASSATTNNTDYYQRDFVTDYGPVPKDDDYLLQALALDFGLADEARRIQDAYHKGGLEELRKLVSSLKPTSY